MAYVPRSDIVTPGSRRDTYRQHSCRNQRTEVATPHSLQWEVRRHFLRESSARRPSKRERRTNLKGEQHTTDRRSEGHTHACSRTRRHDLSHLRSVPLVLIEAPADDIPCADGIMDAGPFLPNTQPGCNSQRQPDRFDEQRPPPEEALHHEAGDDAFDLGNPGTGGVRREGFDQDRGGEGKEYLCGSPSFSFRARRNGENLGGGWTQDVQKTVCRECSLSARSYSTVSTRHML